MGMDNRLNRHLLVTTTLACLVSVYPATAAETDDDDWHLGGEIFLWGAGIGGETLVGDVEIAFDDIFDNLDMAFMGTIAASKNKWIFGAEIIYLDVGNSKTVATDPVNISAKVDMKSLISTLAAGYRLVDSDTSTLHGVFGTRYLDLDMGLDVTVGNLPPIGGSGGEDFWDAVIGLRGEYRFADRWALTYYGDVGTGDSDLTWHAVAAINYRFERSALVLGYAHLEWEFDGNAPISELDVDGPYAGFQFKFF